MTNCVFKMEITTGAQKVPFVSPPADIFFSQIELIFKIAKNKDTFKVEHNQ